ncbi:MAG: glycosyltransferase [Pseudomonadota bacterium]
MKAPRASMPRARIVVMAHNEERRIATCLSSLPLSEAGVAAHVIVNGSSDRTAEIARRFAGAGVREYEQGGKARSWNRFVLEEADPADAFVFVDGDAEITPGSVGALLATLDAHPHANAASGMPCNGRGVEAYRQYIRDEHGVFGDLYALRGSFVERLRQSAIRLPEDLIGDDSLIGAMAKTDLGNEDHWDESRVMPCEEAGFLCEPTQLSLASLGAQYKRMINYSVRHYQNRIVSEIMRGPGPVGLPRHLASEYGRWLPRFAKRRHPLLWWVDRAALRRMAAKA